VVWSRLRDRRLGGLKFRRQQPIGRFVADFYCAEAKIVVEIDGECHDGRRVRDDARDAFMRGEEIEVVRLLASDVSRDLDAAMESLLLRARARVEELSRGRG